MFYGFIPHITHRNGIPYDAWVLRGWVLSVDVTSGGGANGIPIGLVNMYITPIRFWFGTGLLLFGHVEMLPGANRGDVVSCAFLGFQPGGFASITGPSISEKANIQSLGIPNASGRRG